MGYLILGVALMALIYGAAGRRALRRYASWRVASAALAVLVFAAAGFVALRGGWGKAVVLAVMAAALAASARWPRSAAPTAAASMSLSEARATLGVAPGASAAEIKAAYGRLIVRVHPDRGGAAGLAAHLNLARDVLLNSGPGRR